MRTKMVGMTQNKYSFLLNQKVRPGTASVKIYSTLNLARFGFCHPVPQHTASTVGQFRIITRQSTISLDERENNFPPENIGSREYRFNQQN